MKRVKGFEINEDIPSNAKFIGTGNKRKPELGINGTVPVFYYEVADKVQSTKAKKNHDDDVENIVEYLNYKADKSFKSKTEKTRKLIIKWLNTGYTQEDFFRMIDNMCDRWLGDDKMGQYLRPETLFGTKFEGYLNTEKQTTEDDVFGELDSIVQGID